MIPKAFDDIQKSDIDALIENEVSEGKKIEYKLKLPGNSDRDKKEFLADVSSFANSSGGDLLFGLKEKKGVPTEALGLAGIDADAEKQRLESMLLNGLSPRIPGLKMRAIGDFAEGPVLVVRVLQSWTSPHMITFQQWSRFYARSNSGKYPLDVGQIRTAFALSDSLSERIRVFRADRLARIGAGETPLQLEGARLAVLHLVPVVAFAPGYAIDLHRLYEEYQMVSPLNSQSYSRQYNFDGVVTYSHSGSPGATDSYVQVYRNGMLEAVSSAILEYGDENLIPSMSYEGELLLALGKYLRFFHDFDVPPPIIAMLTLWNIKGCRLATQSFRSSMSGQTRAERDNLIVPEVVVDAYDSYDAPLSHMLDTVWQAFGRPRSPYSGHWAEWLAKGTQ